MCYGRPNTRGRLKVIDRKISVDVIRDLRSSAVRFKDNKIYRGIVVSGSIYDSSVGKYWVMIMVPNEKEIKTAYICDLEMDKAIEVYNMLSSDQKKEINMMFGFF
jgi:hypothetical protein